MLLTLQKTESNNQTVICVTDPNSDLHLCAGAEPLWKKISSLLEDEDLKAKSRSQPTPAPRADSDTEAPEDAEDDDSEDDEVMDLVTGLLGRVINKGRAASRRHRSAGKGTKG